MFDYRWNNNAQDFSKHLDTLEAKITLTENMFTPEIAFGRRLETQVLSNPKDYFLTQTVLKALSLQYRIKSACGGLDRKKQVSESLVEDLLTALKKWKEGIDEYVSKEPTDHDFKKIEQLARFKNFAKVLIQNTRATDECFKLIFRDNFPVKILVQYFKTCSVDLKNALLTMRVGFFEAFGVKHLKIETDNKVKDLKYKINSVFVSILNNENKILLNDNKEHTWGQIKKMCEVAKKNPGITEVFQNLGLMLFRPQKLCTFINGVETYIDTTNPKYWENPNLPVFLTLSKEKLERMLNITITDERPCVKTVEGSCIDPDSVNDAHGASTVYLPIGDGLYRCLPFGKYAKVFPKTPTQNACFIGNTVEAELTYPDPSFSHTQRIHGVAPDLLTWEEAEALLTIYGKDIWYFQFGGNNCSGDFQEISEQLFGKEEDGGRTPNYFRKPLVESKFFFPITLAFDLMSELHPILATIYIRAIEILCGSFRWLSRTLVDGTVETESLEKNAFTTTQELYVPGKIVKSILERKIKGFTWYGYDNFAVQTRS